METTPLDASETYRAPDTGDVVSPPTVSEPAQLEPCDDRKTGTAFAPVTGPLEDPTDIGATASGYQYGHEEPQTIDMSGARPRTLTEKGLEYQIEITRKNIRTAISKWRKQAKYIDRLVTESENIEQLKAERDVLSALLEEVSRLGEVYQSMQPLEDKIYDKIEAVEQEDQELSRRLSVIICDLQSDNGSVRSGRSSRRSGRSSHKVTRGQRRRR